MYKTIVGLCVTAVSIGVVGTLHAAETDLATMAKPAYTAAGELVKPEGYRGWVFVGSSLGLSYSEEAPKNLPGLFHHIYIQPEAYRQYVKDGTFPEKTMLVMENYSAGSKSNPNLHGWFEDNLAGVEVALKDKETYADGWAYFNFSSGGGKLKPSAKAFPKAACFDCHAEHAADDNVFVQFYPVLKEEMQKQGRWKGEAPAKTDEKYEEK